MDYRVAGSMLRLARKQLDKTQQQMADDLSISQSLIYNIEAGISKNEALYQKYADYVGIRDLTSSEVEVPILSSFEDIQAFIHDNILPPHFKAQKVEIEDAPNNLFCLPARHITHDWHHLPFEVPQKGTGMFFIHPGIDANRVAKKRDGLCLVWHKSLEELSLMRPIRGDSIQFVLNERSTPIEENGVEYVGMYIGFIDYLRMDDLPVG